MEIRNIHKDAGWYASYDPHEQGRALIRCQQAKIEQLLELLGRVQGEIELSDDPKEYGPEMVLESIRDMISSTPIVSYTEGYFKWEG